jgi:hypothetical protein
MSMKSQWTVERVQKYVDLGGLSLLGSEEIKEAFEVVLAAVDEAYSRGYDEGFAEGEAEADQGGWDEECGCCDDCEGVVKW